MWADFVTNDGGNSYCTHIVDSQAVEKKRKGSLIYMEVSTAHVFVGRSSPNLNLWC